MLKKFLATPILGVLLVSLILAILVVGARRLGFIQTLELSTYDAYLRLAHSTTVEKSEKIVILEITEEDIHHFAQYPINDYTLALALKTLLDSQPYAIGIDIYRDLPVPSLEHPDGKQQLDDVFLHNRDIIAVMYIGDEPKLNISPPPILKKENRWDQIGFNNFLIDPDGTVRRGLLTMETGEEDTADFSLALQLAIHYLEKHYAELDPQEEAIPDSQLENADTQPLADLPLDNPSLDEPPLEETAPEVQRENTDDFLFGEALFRRFQPNDGAYVGATEGGFQILLDFKDSHDSFHTFTLRRLLEGKVDRSLIENKIVLVGMTAGSVPDYFHTPLSQGSAEEEGLIRGIKVHSQIISQLIRAGIDGETPRKIWGDQSEEAWIAFWSLLGVFLWVRSWTVGQFWGIVGAGLSVLIGGTYWGFVNGWWIPVVSPVFTWVGMTSMIGTLQAYHAQKEKLVIMHLFKKAVSKDVVKYLYQNRDLILQDGYPVSRNLTVTVLFSDLQGFTSTAETMTPTDLLNWLNDYFECMVQVIIRHEGVVDDYYGDAIKADFSPPLPPQEEEDVRKDALNAVLCALEMTQELEKLNTQLVAQNRPQVRMRIGIYTGNVVAGCLGSKDRMKYTTIGDAVNIASRLESFAKEDKGPRQLGVTCRVLIGESTYQHLPPHIRTEWFGNAQLKGKEQLVGVYRVFTQKETSTDATRG